MLPVGTSRTGLWSTIRNTNNPLTAANLGFLTEGANLLFGKNVAKNCMKIKEIGPRGRALLPRPRSTNA